VGLVGKNGCGKSTFFALVRGELAIDSGSFSLPAGWQIAGVAQETPALDCSALDYDRRRQGVPRPEAQLAQAEADDNGMLVAELHGKLDTQAPTASVPAPPSCCTAWVSAAISSTRRCAASPVAGACA
jgi:ATP-binding cassette subfamily F protein 3